MKRGNMVTRIFRIICAAYVLTAGQLPAYATETGSMICKGGIVSIGDAAGEVMAKCGEPATKSNREDKRVSHSSKPGYGKVVTSVSIDDWLFNFGPNEFQYQLILENGRVTRIDSLDYGY